MEMYSSSEHTFFLENIQGWYTKVGFAVITEITHSHIFTKEINHPSTRN